ncbi:organic hydroperoxide resistance protein [Pseudomonas batumici]|uniref:Organic hydroperoxide resistance protein n=1 Tax=Pseudomonas batumici TaxID=226910 RepID=A0A0C2EVI6_9PSED|nr:organic hydroperoxide resistance protein [Pseudomonas batumici]KIH82653.1 Organic hydroperoxide resistance protein [Pseudomonas batumici]
MSLETILYAGQTSVTGGREGRALSTDGALDVQLSTPRELGGAGGPGTNPEQLFAAGHSACFLGAMKRAAVQAKVALPATTRVTSKVGLGKDAGGGFGLEVELRIAIPGFSRDQVQALVDQAHQICPYSLAIRGNVDVTLIVED